MAVLNNCAPGTEAGSDGRKEHDDHDRFVALDIGELTEQDGIDSPPTTARLSVSNSFSRKARSGVGGERKDRKAAPAPADGNVTPGGGAHGHGSERPPLVVNLSPEGEGGGLYSPAAPSSAGARTRRVGSGRRRPPPYLDPKKVLLFFGSLSSMGSLILLYFMLSMGKNSGSY